VPHRLSKSRFTYGLQCHRQLWWRVHDPGAPELVPDAALQARFDMGKRVGNRARQEFPGARLIELDHRNPQQAVAATRHALARGDTAILEASFIEAGIFVAVDALTKEGDAWVITEVKASASVKPQYLPDAAVQAHVVEQAGLPVARIELMHLNTQHRHPNDGLLFTRANITEEVNALRADIPAEALAQLAMLEGPLPDVEPGDHCTSPYPCPFLQRCTEPAPAHAIETLYYLSAGKRTELRGNGVHSVDQIPSDFPLSKVQKRQRTAVRDNRLVIEPGLERTLAQYRYPIAMLDFETINPALPVWDGCSPFGRVPVQFSVHLLAEDGSVTHHAYLAEGQGDPRPGIAEALVAALEGAQTILAWNASFEKKCLTILGESAPEHAAALTDARAKVEDLLPVVRNHVYHPEFNGSFSIKSVVPALLPELAYDDLQIADGEIAMSQLETILCRPDELESESMERIRGQLEAYCKRDTEVMVELLHFLQELLTPRSNES